MTPHQIIALELSIGLPAGDIDPEEFYEFIDYALQANSGDAPFSLPDEPVNLTLTEPALQVVCP